MKRRNTFASKMQAAIDAKIAASKAYESGNTDSGRKLALLAHEITSAAAQEAEMDR